MSAGSSDENDIFLPVAGWTNAERARVQRLPPQRVRDRAHAPVARRPPVVRSPSSGQPSAARCTRTWCVRPVSSRASIRAAPGNRSTHAPVGDRALAGPHAAGELLARVRIAPVERVDAPARPGRLARHQRLVDPLDGVRLERRRRARHRRVVLGDHQQARGVLVDAVDDPRAQLAADAAQVAHVREQRVHQRPRLVPRRRVHHQPGRLVDDDQPAILVDDRQRHRLGRDRRSRTGGGGVQTTTSPARSLRDGAPAAPLTVTAASPICRASCERDTSATLLRQEQVQPLAGRLRRDHEAP